MQIPSICLKYLRNACPCIEAYGFRNNIVGDVMRFRKYICIAKREEMRCKIAGASCIGPNRCVFTLK